MCKRRLTVCLSEDYLTATNSTVAAFLQPSSHLPGFSGSPDVKDSDSAS